MNVINRLASCAILPAQFIKKNSLNAGRKAFNFFDSKELTLKTKDGVKINAMLIKANILHRIVSSLIYLNPFRRKKILIYVQGNYGAYENSPNGLIIEGINSLGHDILLFNYRGVGKSRGSPTTKGLEKDLNAAIDYAKNELKYSDENISVWGRSLGGAIATRTLSKRQNSKIRLLNIVSFSSISDVIDNLPIFKIFKVFLKVLVKIVGWNLNVVKDLQKIKGKKFIVEASRDELLGKKGSLANALNKNDPNHTIIRIPGDHNCGINFYIMRKILK